MNYKEEEEYEFSECADKVIAFHYPDTLTPKHPLFETRMIELQLALIECKTPLMFKSDKMRALKTVKYLRQKLKEVRLTCQQKQTLIEALENSLE